MNLETSRLLSSAKFSVVSASYWRQVPGRRCRPRNYPLILWQRSHVRLGVPDRRRLCAELYRTAMLTHPISGSTKDGRRISNVYSKSVYTLPLTAASLSSLDVKVSKTTSSYIKIGPNVNVWSSSSRKAKIRMKPTVLFHMRRVPTSFSISVSVSSLFWSTMFEHFVISERTLGGLDVFLPYVKDYVDTYMGKSITTQEWKAHLFDYYKSQPDKIKALNTVDFNVGIRLVCHVVLF